MVILRPILFPRHTPPNEDPQSRWMGWISWYDTPNDIRDIDEAALERAARNIFRGRGRRVATEDEAENGLEPFPEEAGTVRVEAATLPADDDQRKGTNSRGPEGCKRMASVATQSRSHRQIFSNSASHCPAGLFDRDQKCMAAGGSKRLGLVVSSRFTTRNLKIEIGARRGAAEYPIGDHRPIALFKELQVRTFDYMLLLPSDPGYDEMWHLNQNLEPIGKGFRRNIRRL